MRLSKEARKKIQELAGKHGLSFEEVKNIVSSQWDFIRETTNNINLEDRLTSDEFDKIKTNFNIPAIGKLYASYYLYTKIQESKQRKLDKKD